MPDTPTPALVRRFPKKYMSAGALFFDEQGALLLVKPTYKEGWEIPGGIVEADESPMQAYVREVCEELGLSVTPAPLLVMDYKSRGEGPSDSLQFVFLGGTLTPAEIQAITLPEAELSEYRFLPLGMALATLPSALAPRVAGGLRAIAEGRVLLLHDGHEET